MCPYPIRLTMVGAGCFSCCPAPSLSVKHTGHTHAGVWKAARTKTAVYSTTTPAWNCYCPMFFFYQYWRSIYYLQYLFFFFSPPFFLTHQSFLSHIAKTAAAVKDPSPLFLSFNNIWYTYMLCSSLGAWTLPESRPLRLDHSKRKTQIHIFFFSSSSLFVL